MDERENDERCQLLLDRLVKVLGLKFVPAKDVVEDGWYVWRNSPDWPIEDHTVFELANGLLCEPQPADSYGAVWEMVENEPYGELAGPIIG